MSDLTASNGNCFHPNKDSGNIVQYNLPIKTTLKQRHSFYKSMIDSTVSNANRFPAKIQMGILEEYEPPAIFIQENI